MQMQKVLMHSDFFFLRRLARKIEVSGVKNIFLSQPAMKKKKRRIKKTWSSHLANAACKEQELFVTQTSAKMPKIGMIMQDQVFLYIFHSFFFFLLFFPPRVTFQNVFIYIFHFTCANLRVTWDILSWFHQTLCESSTPFPAAFLSCLPLCLFGYARAPVCLGWGNRAVVYELSPGLRYPAAFS